MAISNQERVGKALDQLKAGLAPFVEREFRCRYCGQFVPSEYRTGRAYHGCASRHESIVD